MKVIRQITYEGPRENIEKQMSLSIRDGTFPWLTTVTVETVYSDDPSITGGRPEGWQPQPGDNRK